MGHMASQGYRDWIAAGKPFTLAAPAKRLRDTLRGYGYTAYDIGNERHQLADPPEDHMPYSATGWPNRSPRWYGFALDIMPPPAGSKLPTLPQLLGQIYADKMAGHPGVAWLKYMNWEPQGPSGPCYHDKWQPSHVRTTSGDRGHGHLSGRSDHYLTDTTGGYDPVARYREAHAMAELSEYRQRAVEYTDNRIAAICAGDDKVKGTDAGPLGKGSPVWIVTAIKGITATLAEIKAAVTAPRPAEPVTLTQADREEIARLIAEQLNGTYALQFVPTAPATPSARL